MKGGVKKIKKIARLTSLRSNSTIKNFNETTTFAGNMGREENNFTPTKRKLLETRPVHNLVSMFELPDLLSDEFSHTGLVGCSESPAKRQKIQAEVNQPNSQ